VVETIGERIHRLRLERRLSQRALAGPGVTGAYISRIEAGSRTPSVKALRLVAGKLKVSVAYLETGQELTDAEERDIRLSDLELSLRLGELTAEFESALAGLVEEASGAGDRGAELRAQIALGLAAAHRGDHDQAAARLEQVARAEGVSPASHPDVLTALGHAYSELGRFARAIELFGDCLRYLDEHEPEDDVVRIRFATYLSYALADAGDLGGARDVLNQAIARAAGVEDAYSRVRLYWSRARLDSMSGNSTKALANIRRAITLLRETEDTLHLGLAYLLQGEFQLEQDRLDDAAATFELAAPLIKGADAQHRAGLCAEQAKLAARQGHGEQAVALAGKALAILGSGTPAEQGRARWALGEGLAAQGKIEKAMREFDRAEQLLTGEGRYTRQLLQARASIARKAGHFDEAIDLLKRATQAPAAAPRQTRA
jgi:tetratricopeptide (TPR) repeat protein